MLETKKRKKIRTQRCIKCSYYDPLENMCIFKNFVFGVPNKGPKSVKITSLNNCRYYTISVPRRRKNAFLIGKTKYYFYSLYSHLKSVNKEYFFTADILKIVKTRKYAWLHMKKMVNMGLVEFTWVLSPRRNMIKMYNISEKTEIKIKELLANNKMILKVVS